MEQFGGVCRLIHFVSVTCSQVDLESIWDVMGHIIPVSTELNTGETFIVA